VGRLCDIIDTSAHDQWMNVVILALFIPTRAVSGRETLATALGGISRTVHSSPV
jgi:hypothetical protein